MANPIARDLLCRQASCLVVAWSRNPGATSGEHRTILIVGPVLRIHWEIDVCRASRKARSMNGKGRIRQVLLITTSLATACQERQHAQANNLYPVALDATQDPGQHVAATNDLSLQLAGSDPAGRRAWFQILISGSKHQCNQVTSAVLKAGDNGLDLWRVGCDGRGWLVTLGPGYASSVESCSNTKSPYCTDGLKALEWRS